MSPLIHNWCPTVRTVNLCGSLVVLGPVEGGVEFKTAGSFDEGHVRFVENGGPLEGGTCSR